MKYPVPTLLKHPLLCLCFSLLAALNSQTTASAITAGANTAFAAAVAPAKTANGETRAKADVPAYRKADLDAFFTKLDNGQPVTVAAIGGSITMHSTGWALKTVDAIRSAYPQGDIRFVNAGISGTGSSFGLFRLQRDVIDTRPDLVFIEFAVNDGGTPDQAVIRNLESMVVALCSLPEPPAIVFVQSASDAGTPLARHNRVANHYGILNINTQPAVDAFLETNNLEWEALFSDAVHPLDAGHTLYAQTIWQAMQDDRHLPPGSEQTTALPALLAPTAPLTRLTLIAPNFQQDGWEYRAEKYHNGWLGRYFLGTLQNAPQAVAFNIPFYGRAFGIALLTREGAGSLRVAIDGERIDDITVGRDWFYNIYTYPELLEERWHVLSLLPLTQGDEPAKVRIAFLLGEDQGNAPAIPAEFWRTTWPQSIAKLAELEKLNWQPVPAEDWLIIGPFGGSAERPWLNPAADLDLDTGISTTATPDTDARYTGFNGRELSWQSATGKDGWVDLGALYSVQDRGVSYAWLRIEAEQADAYSFELAIDYFACVYVNGHEAERILTPHGNPRKGIPIMLPLDKGTNTILLKVHAGSKGFGFRLDYPSTAGLKIITH